MSGVGLVITVEDDRVRGALGEIEALGADMSPLLDEVGAYVAADTQEHFELGVGPDGQAWIPSMRAREEGGKTLVDSAQLEHSIHHVLDGSHAVEIGTNKIYGAIHQVGGTIHAKGGGSLHFVIGQRDIFVDSVTLPARPWLGLSDRNETAIIAIVGDHYDRITAYWGA